MGERWNVYRILCWLMMFQVLCKDCLSINLEGLALLEFRSRIEVDPYGALENWNQDDEDSCDWNGVHCVDGKVVKLDLKELSLKGSLAPELGKLRSLRSLILNKNNFSGPIPKDIGKLPALEILDLRGNNFDGDVPKEIIEMLSLKHLLLCNNHLQGDISCAEDSNEHGIIQEQNVSYDLIGHTIRLNRKVGHSLWETGLQKFKQVTSLFALVERMILESLDLSLIHRALSQLRYEGSPSTETSITGIAKPHLLTHIHETIIRRKLIEESRNFQATPSSRSGAVVSNAVPSTGSGSFSAVPRPKTSMEPSAAPAGLQNTPPAEATPTKPADTLADKLANPSSKAAKWIYIPVAVGVVLIIAFALFLLLLCRKKRESSIGPWKTGISGQLQKAFVTGVPKLKRSELEAACEDFSNIIVSFPEFTVYKGTLSSGVEIAVVSTSVMFAKDWSKRSEKLFRKKIDTLSRINHKNFVNLLGYCEEDLPFTRMMVLEYATNGDLYEHLHGEDFELLDWSARMRIIMGTAYCLQFMHELSPQVSHSNLQSRSILMSEDCAAKLVDMSVWHEVAVKGKGYGDDDGDHSETIESDPATNMYNFGMILLETVTGKVPDEEQKSFTNWALEYLNGDRRLDSFLDPRLKCHKENELVAICEVIQECIHPDPKKRPKMREVAFKLREALGISPEAASPRLSPLWWAELEILSVEAS